MNVPSYYMWNTRPVLRTSVINILKVACFNPSQPRNRQTNKHQLWAKIYWHLLSWFGRWKLILWGIRNWNHGEKMLPRMRASNLNAHTPNLIILLDFSQRHSARNPFALSVGINKGRLGYINSNLVGDRILRQIKGLNKRIQEVFDTDRTSQSESTKSMTSETPSLPFRR